MNNRINIAAPLLITVLLFIPLLSSAQGIRLKASDEPLSSVLTNLRNQYSIQISFNDRQLSEYTVSADTLFGRPGDLFDWLLDPLPLGYSVSGEVIVIFPVQKQRKVNTYLVSGKVFDRYTGESLPFSHVSIEGRWTVTDFLGQFSYMTQNEPPYSLVTSYLGYFVLDTVVFSGSDLTLGMIPSNIKIDEIIVRGMVLEKSVQSGRNTGEIRINHQIAKFLPGNGDNSVFNLLRLQPGITAAGELANDLIIWGSYEGQSRVLFDGFTIFGLKIITRISVRESIYGEGYKGTERGLRCFVR
ncbi:MAG: carboxypeptidase-like regulatory domain-containing protein [Bacteroidales bacterium]